MFSDDLVEINRETYEMLQFVGDIGGLLDGLHLFGTLLVMPFVSFKAKSRIMHNLFMFKPYEHDEDLEAD